MPGNTAQAYFFAGLEAFQGACWWERLIALALEHQEKLSVENALCAILSLSKRGISSSARSIAMVLWGVMSYAAFSPI